MINCCLRPTHFATLLWSRRKEGESYNISELQHDSKCDNVVLEQELALILHQRSTSHKTVLFPLLVGDLQVQDGVGEMYTDFFVSGCKPELPDVKVWAIAEKLKGFLPRDLPPLRTVRTVFDTICSIQGHKVMGIRRQVIMAHTPKNGRLAL